MKRKYSWKYGVYGKADPQLVGEELEIIEQKGELTHLEVLEYARENEDSELHKCFEWDDTIAGELYRRHQASHILSHISFVVSEDNKPKEKQKVYVSIVNKEEKRVFKNIERVVKNDEEYEQLLQSTQQALETLRLKYEKLIKKEDFKDLIFNFYKSI